MEVGQSFLPQCDKGYLPIFLLAVCISSSTRIIRIISGTHTWRSSVANQDQSAAAAFYSSVQAYRSPQLTRWIYNEVFIPDVSLVRPAPSSNTYDGSPKLIPVRGSDEHSADVMDKIAALAGRLFGTYTFIAGLLRGYGAYCIEDRVAYQLALWGYIVAAVHFTSETIIFKAIRSTTPPVSPLIVSYSGVLWMVLQYRHYTSS
jgi:hypothetical protein